MPGSALPTLACITLLVASSAWGGGAGQSQAMATGASPQRSDAATVPSGGIVSELDIAYPPPPGGNPTAARLDIHYVPDGQPKRWMVFVHGGSWVGGDKSNLLTPAEMMPWLVGRNHAVAAVNFRLASPPGTPLTVTYSHQATDIAYALAWLESNAATYGVTRSEPVLFGYSSGAHLVALLAADGRYLQSAGLAANHLHAAISFDVHAYDVPYALTLMPGSEIANNIPLILHLFGSTTAAQLEGSPSHFVTPGSVAPSLLVSADPSQVVGSKGYIASEASRRHWDLLQAAGVAAGWSHFDQETHASLVANFGAQGDAPTEVVRLFLDGLEPTGAVVGTVAPSFALRADPNPVRDATSLMFELPEERPVRLDLFDVAGRRVRGLVNAVRGAGTHVVVWDGRDDGGRRLSGGVYAMRLVVDGRAVARRMVVLGR